ITESVGASQKHHPSLKPLSEIPTKIKTEEQLNNFIREKMKEVLSQVQWADAVYLYSGYISHYEHGGDAYIKIIPLKRGKSAQNRWYYSDNWETYKFEFKHDFTHDDIVEPVKILTRDGKEYKLKVSKKTNPYSGLTTVYLK
ncbi:MAG: hypothetical protein ACP5IZ_12030, partial [Thermoprotei archaeon]